MLFVFISSKIHKPAANEEAEAKVFMKNTKQLRLLWKTLHESKSKKKNTIRGYQEQKRKVVTQNFTVEWR